jgi:hypothetical protein
MNNCLELTIAPSFTGTWIEFYSEANKTPSISKISATTHSRATVASMNERKKQASRPFWGNAPELAKILGDYISAAVKKHGGGMLEKSSQS